MNIFTLMLPLLLVPLAAASAEPTANSRGTVERFSFDVQTSLKTWGRNKNQIQSASTLAVPKGNSVEHGVLGSFRPEWISIDRKSFSSKEASYTFKVSIDGKNLVANASYCDPSLRCKPAKTETKGAGQFESSIPGSTWSIRLMGNPCKDGAQQCDITFPSWYLERRLNSKDGSGPNFPRFLTALEDSNGVAIADSVTGDVWFRYDFSTNEKLAALGSLNSFDWLDDSLVDLGFDSGHIVLDLFYDRLYLVNSQGVFVSNRGLGDHSHLSFFAQFDKEKAQPGSSHNALVRIEKDRFVWQDGVVNLNRYTNSLSNFLIQPSLVDTKVLGALASGEKVVAQANLTDAILVLSNKSLFALNEAGRKDIPLPSNNFGLKINSHGDLLLKQNQGSQCRWQHFAVVKNTKTGMLELSPSALVAPCEASDDAIVLGGSVDKATVTSSAGNKINVSVFNP